MSKKILSLSLFFILGFSSVLYAQDKAKINQKYKSYQTVGSTLPQFKIISTDGHVVLNKDLQTKNHLFVIMFNPTCGHCINETKMLCKNATLFKNSKVVFMPYKKSMTMQLSGFIIDTHISDYKEFVLGFDANDNPTKLMRVGLYPQINIYKNNKLVKTFNGDVAISKLKPYLP